MKKVKEPVKLRTATLKSGPKSLYLDTIVDGVRRYEFLKLYLIPETTAEARAQNTETMRAANAIKAQRVLEVINRKGGIKNTTATKKITLGAFVEAIIKKKERNGERALHYKRQLNYLKKWKLQDTRLANIDADFCLDLVDKIKRIRKTTDASRYELQSTFVAVMNEAKRCEFIDINPFDKVERRDKIKAPTESNREYLTIEELNKLIATPYPRYSRHRNAFLFSCFTGLRLSDVRGLCWGDIKSNASGTGLEIRIKMQKTRQPVIIPLSAEAKRFLPPRTKYTKADAKVFEHISSSWMCTYIADWCKKAGITKHITFHSARHTFATMLLTLGADIYTISKLLGHTSIQHTQRYTKLVDTKRKNATDLFSGHFN